MRFADTPIKAGPGYEFPSWRSNPIAAARTPFEQLRVCSNKCPAFSVIYKFFKNVKCAVTAMSALSELLRKLPKEPSFVFNNLQTLLRVFSGLTPFP